MKNKQNSVYASREEVKENILALFAEQEEFSGQEVIIKALGERGVATTQAMVSRVLREDIEAERNENGFWALSDKGEYRQRLKMLEALFDKAGGSPRLYSRVKVVVLRTETNYNVLLARQIADTFEDEVISTFCPNDTDVVIYYQRRKKRLKDAPQKPSLEVEPEGGDKPDQADQPEEAEIDPYKKSKMRIEIVKLCKKIRNMND
jgi:arginine repressor